MEQTLDYRTLLPACEAALTKRHPVILDLAVGNTDRAVGTMLSSEISRRHGGQGLRDNSIQLNFKGSAGQSFMAFGAKGITATLEGEVNDYCGKGLSGAKVVVIPPEESAIMAESNVICGNVTLYGATAGFLYIRGLAGERFAVRNSGAHAVVEGLGDHGCEYMTGGSVIVLGRVGRNFAAGMSGGYAFVYDVDGLLQKRINREMVEVASLNDEEDESFVLRQLQEHVRLTRSSVAAQILENWNVEKSRFLSIVPSAYRAMMRHRERDRVQPTVRVVGGDHLGAILEEGGYHG